MYNKLEYYNQIFVFIFFSDQSSTFNNMKKGKGSITWLAKEDPTNVTKHVVCNFQGDK